MFGTNPEKVGRKIDALVEELIVIGERITEHEEQFEMAKRVGIARDGDDQTIQVWRRVQAQLITGLSKAKEAMFRGDEDFRQINRILPMTKKQVREIAADISAADRAAEVGRRLAQERFGGGS
ncbi:hypothetical protein J4558_04750 [Leptolyngbya sp. 15MV]|nr:hypothetical protein J4558_04750 [Leptolyngbya sp. 15MV]